MSQLNMHITQEFNKQLKKLMKLRGFKTKSEAIRHAVNESVKLALKKTRTTDFTSWVGCGKKAPLNPKPHFRSDDDLWSDK